MGRSWWGARPSAREADGVAAGVMVTLLMGAKGSEGGWKWKI